MKKIKRNQFINTSIVVFILVIFNITSAFALNDGAIVTKLQEVVTSAENVLKIIFAGWGMYGILLAGVKYFNSEEQEAKKALMHILIALILFALTDPILQMFGLK